MIKKLTVIFALAVGSLVAQRPAVYGPEQAAPPSGVTTVNGASGDVVIFGGQSATTGSSLLYGNGSGGFSNATVGTGLNFAGGTLSSSVTQSTGANPTASVGLTAVNGVATTFLRSDGAPALSQAIVPTWTGTHSFSNVTPIQVESTSTSGIQIYNTSDKVTNWERIESFWSGNQGIVRTNAGGSGSTRALSLQSRSMGGSITSIDINRAGSNQISFSYTNPLPSAGSIFVFSGGQQTATSGSIGYLVVAPTYNQSSGTAANTDLLINRTQTAVGSGTQRLIDAQVGGTSQFNVSNNGRIGVKQATNGSGGTFTLVAGAATVANTSVTANSVIVFTLKTVGGTVGTQAPFITAITAGASFSVTGAITNTSTYNYIIFESQP